MDSRKISNSIRLLKRLDELLDSHIELTIYGRAALELGFANPKPEFSKSLDVDIVLWLGQAEEIHKTSNFWEAIEILNQEFEQDGLYISHIFEENQVILTADWKTKRIPVNIKLEKLSIYRLSDIDLILSKMMRYDPTDLEDIEFILTNSKISSKKIYSAIGTAKLPDIPEVKEQFELCKTWLMEKIKIINQGLMNL